VIKLPFHIINSLILSNTQKELLASIEELPVVNPAFEDDRLKNIFQYYSLIPEEMDLEVHQYAAELLQQKKVDEAWQVLLSSNIL
jgi:hypothetical protein